MEARRIDDEEPGRVPVIRSDEDSTTFEFQGTSPESGEHLVIRCDAKGEVWVKLAPEEPNR